MKIHIPRKTTFEVPEGCHRAILRDLIKVEDKIKGCTDQVRFVWEIEKLNDKRLQYLAGKNYCTDCGNSSVLLGDLGVWLGEELSNLGDAQGDVELDQLKGRPADILIEHIHNPNYQKPFANVKGVYPPGTLQASGTSVAAMLATLQAGIPVKQ